MANDKPKGRLERAKKRQAKRPKAPKGAVAKIIDYARRYRRPCRYALLTWTDPKRKHLESCHKTVGAARAAAKQWGDKMRGDAGPGWGKLRWRSSYHAAIYSIATGKRVLRKPRSK